MILISGMNLQHGFETHEHAFYVICGGMGLTSTLLFRMLLRRFRNLDADTSEAKRAHYQVLKNYQSILDEVEARLLKGDSSDSTAIMKDDFEKVLKDLVPNVQPDELTLMFKSYDTNRSGTIEGSEIEAAKAFRKST